MLCFSFWIIFSFIIIKFSSFGLSSIAPRTLSDKIATCISLPGIYFSIKISPYSLSFLNILKYFFYYK